ncbi:glutamate 5-kinase [Heliobacterium gestii]|uniref:Glutamate 5-kinase n=1 Tax=Heliomicrobium gestii TaxID=2699 RepID=A0A845LHF5_HELGE|nr:glutamate 5-kinase [Heliomicrobium gestii]MBM7866868.1 glutamate 5-kinase [Heliomicrobium gestii]MZP42296.1 glutamate 5-kinase [Heliomicrobium gestii]
MFGRQDLPKARRVIVKVGTSTLTHGTGKLNLEQMEKLVRQLADLSNRGHQVILVSSGAVGAGMGRLGLEKRPKAVPEKQACAAVGQGILMHMYEKLFAEYGLVVAQVLLTRDDFAFRERYINAGNTLEALLRMNVIPIINENDTVSIDEIRLRFGDNDTLSALVAGLVQGDVLILLTDIEGLYSANPRVDAEAVFIPEVAEITREIEAMAAGAGSNLGTGGMATKLQAAKIAVESGVAMVIAQGSRPNGLREIMNGEEVGTLFFPNEKPLPGYKRWLAFSSASSGRVYIDAGAAEAIVSGGKSLLPCGITRADGDFQSGDMVSIIAPEGLEVARGVTQYSADQVRRIMGKQCQDIEAALGAKGVDEVVHRDDLTVMVSRHIG